jgi:UDP-N-acetylglucosamine 1-carboxyvinyltransferase
MTAIIDKLREIGVGLRIDGTTIHVDGSGPFTAVDCTALPHPAIPTDVQAQLTALLTVADGISIVTDKVFPDRFMHVSELARMGACIRREGSSAIISGATRLSGASVMASDLRASAALVLAALAADGPSVVRRIYHLDRGYERLESKLRQLGADVERVDDSPTNVPPDLRDVAVETGVVSFSPGGPHWQPSRLPAAHSRPTH